MLNLDQLQDALTRSTLTEMFRSRVAPHLDHLTDDQVWAALINSLISGDGIAVTDGTDKIIDVDLAPLPDTHDIEGCKL